MSEIGWLIDTKQHMAILQGQQFPLMINSSAHYSVPLSPLVDKNAKLVLHVNAEMWTAQEKKTKALKLHRQLGHSSKEKLTSLVKSSDCNNKEFIDAIGKVCDKCKFCDKYRMEKPKPIVGFPKGQRFNQCVCMDLKELIKGKKWILHLIDSATNYTAANIV